MTATLVVIAIFMLAGLPLWERREAIGYGPVSGAAFVVVACLLLVLTGAVHADPSLGHVTLTPATVDAAGGDISDLPVVNYTLSCEGSDDILLAETDVSTQVVVRNGVSVNCNATETVVTALGPAVSVKSVTVVVVPDLPVPPAAPGLR